jgi:hypothetical protein
VSPSGTQYNVWVGFLQHGKFNPGHDFDCSTARGASSACITLGCMLRSQGRGKAAKRMVTVGWAEWQCVQLFQVWRMKAWARSWLALPAGATVMAVSVAMSNLSLMDGPGCMARDAAAAVVSPWCRLVASLVCRIP